MKVWITKYALSKGIFSIEAKYIKPKLPSSLIIPLTKTNEFPDFWFKKSDWCKTEKEAKKHAKEMALKKLKSLNKLKEQITFKVLQWM